MKFCPKCGSPRAGKFCESCGFEFPVPMTSTRPVESTEHPMPSAPRTNASADPAQDSAAAASESTSSKAGVNFERAPGWYSDPLQERLWDGESWTDLVRPASGVLLNPSTSASAEPEMVKIGKTRVQRTLPKKVLLEGLAYGPAFTADNSCYNCGEKHKNVPSSCTSCGAAF